MLWIIPTLLLCMSPEALCHLLCRNVRSAPSQLSEITVPEKLNRTADSSDWNITEIADNSRLQYSVRFGGRTRILHLVKAQDFMADTYSASHYLEDGSLVTEARNNQNHCCYTGVVDGVKDSSVSLCVCHGLSGYLSIGDKAFTIDPVTDNSQEHKVTRTEHVRIRRHIPPLSSNIMGHKNELGIELFLVADRQEFLKNNEDLKKTEHYLICLAYHLSQIYYSQLKIKIFLVGIEVWTRENKVPISNNSTKALRDFMRWSNTELLPRKHYDYAQLISGVSFDEYSLGEAYMEKMCSGDMSGGVVKDTQLGSREVAKYVAHEIGHNLGMPHDDRYVYCSTGRGTCLMSSNIRSWMNPIFSDRSKDYLNMFLTDKNNNINCLLDQPNSFIHLESEVENDSILYYRIGMLMLGFLLLLISAGLIALVACRSNTRTKIIGFSV